MPVNMPAFLPRHRRWPRPPAAAPSVAAADLLKAVLAVHRPALGGQEGHLGRGAADGADHVVHGARPGDAATLAPQRPALRAATRLVQQAPGLVELLLAGCERERDPAIAASQRLVNEGGHRYPPWYMLGAPATPVPAQMHAVPPGPAQKYSGD